MDVVFEVRTSYLVEILNERLSRERLILPLLLPHNDDVWVFHHARLAALEWLPAGNSRETIRVAGMDVAGERLVQWLDVPQLRARAHLALHFAPLSTLRRLPPGEAAATTRFHLPVSLQVRLPRAGQEVRLMVDLTDVDLEQLRPFVIEQLRAGRTLDPAEQGVIEREADGRVAELRGQVFDQLRRTSAGSFSTAVDLRALREMFGGAVPAPYNAGIALLASASDGSGATPESNLAIAIQFESGRWFIREPLEAARASGTIWSWWNDFHRHRRSSTRAGEGWALHVRGEVLADALRAQLSSAIGERSDAEVRRRGPVSTRWRAPLAPEFPDGSIRADFAVHLTRFGVDAEARAFAQLRRGSDREVLIVTRFEWDLNEVQVAGWAALAGLAGAGVGATIGGAAGAGVGAAVGFAAGFVSGFTAAEIAAHAFTPPLPAPPSCEQRGRELECRFLFPSDVGGLISGSRVLRVSGAEVGIWIAGTASASTLRPARPAVVRWRSFRWQRTGPLFARAWSAVLEFDLVNRGEMPLLAGPVVAYGDGAELYRDRVRVPAGPIPGDGGTRLRLVVPRAELEVERAAGRLRPPRLVLFTNAGARVLETTELPAPVSDEQIDRIDSIEATAEEVRRMERAGRVLDHAFPQPPDPGLAVRAHTLLQVAARRGDPATQIALVDTTSQAVLATSEFASNGEAALTALVPGVPQHVGLMVLPAKLSPSQLPAAVAEGLLDAGDGTIVRDAFAAAFGDAMVPPSPEPAPNRPIVTLEGWFDLWIDRVQPGMVEAAMRSIRAQGYTDSGMDVAASRTTFAWWTSPEQAALRPRLHGQLEPLARPLHPPAHRQDRPHLPGDVSRPASRLCGTMELDMEA